ncbi:MAG TPA: zinc ribbon domain-containing protein [Nitrososphaerales archaeon]|nr:zinc ribbon domain-containing protein [Nitrososphaerales archaeon]
MSSVKTYLLVAMIFNIFAVIIWALVSLFLFFIVIPVVFLILSAVILSRTLSMRSAAESGDIAKLKSLNSLGWAIVALIFTGVINGIMLIIANGTINDLQPVTMQSAPMTPVQPATLAPSSPAPQSTSKYCANCGTQMASFAMYCPKCGARQP